MAPQSKSGRINGRCRRTERGDEEHRNIWLFFRADFWESPLSWLPRIGWRFVFSSSLCDAIRYKCMGVLCVKFVKKKFHYESFSYFNLKNFFLVARSTNWKKENWWKMDLELERKTKKRNKCTISISNESLCDVIWALSTKVLRQESTWIYFFIFLPIQVHLTDLSAFAWHSLILFV